MVGSAGIKAEAFVSVKEKRSLFWLLSPLRILSAAAGAAGTVVCFMSCYDTGVSKLMAVFAAVIACLLFGVSFSLKKRYILPCSAVLSAVYTAAVFVLRNSFCNGFANVINVCMSAVSSVYKENQFIYLLYPDSAESDTAVFIFLTAFFIGMLYSWGMVLHSSLAPVMAASVFPVEMCLYFGFAPDYAAFFAVLASWFAVFAGELCIEETSDVYERVHKKAASQCIFAITVIVMLCALIVTAGVRLSGYTRPESVENIYNKVKDYIVSGQLEEKINEIKTSEIIKRESTINHGKLGENGNITFSGDTVLQVTMPKSSDTVYLRGYVGSVYTGNSWEELPESSLNELQKINDSFQTEGLNTMLLGSYNLWLAEDLYESSFVVKNISANDEYCYVPYNLVPDSIGHLTIKNDAVISSGSDTWFGRYYNNPSSCYGYNMLLNTQWIVPGLVLANDINSYRSFVYSENYLALPDNFEGAEKVFDEKYYSFITQESGSEGKSTLTEQQVFGRKLFYIKKWLRDNCEYSLNVGKLPAGKDFADHFLTETRAGSCTHFATAAALLCRYAGIPSRYVEGYVIKPMDFVGDKYVYTVDVTDARAHAWVEIYVDGFGWYPMEFTSGYGNVMTAVTTAPAVTEAETTAQTEQEITTETETQDEGDVTTAAAVTEAATQTETQPAETQASTENTVTESAGFSVFGGDKEGPVYEKVYDLTVPLLIGFAICAAVAFLGIRRLIIVKKCSMISHRDNAAELQYKRFMKLVHAAKLPNKSDCSYSDYAKKLSRFSFVGDTAEIVIDTALKAEFSGEKLTVAEKEEVETAVDRSVKQYIAGLNRLQRFYASYIIGIA